jgi:hypothetical protein
MSSAVQVDTQVHARIGIRQSLCTAAVDIARSISQQEYSLEHKVRYRGFTCLLLLYVHGIAKLIIYKSTNISKIPNPLPLNILRETHYERTEN